MTLDLIAHVTLLLIVAEAGYVLLLGALAAFVIAFEIEKSPFVDRMPMAAVPLVLSSLAAAAMIGIGRFLLGA